MICSPANAGRVGLEASTGSASSTPRRALRSRRRRGAGRSPRRRRCAEPGPGPLPSTGANPASPSPISRSVAISTPVGRTIARVLGREVEVDGDVRARRQRRGRASRVDAQIPSGRYAATTLVTLLSKHGSMSPAVSVGRGTARCCARRSTGAAPGSPAYRRCRNHVVGVAPDAASDVIAAGADALERGRCARGRRASLRRCRASRASQRVETERGEPAGERPRSPRRRHRRGRSRRRWCRGSGGRWRRSRPRTCGRGVTARPSRTSTARRALSGVAAP